MPKNIVICCDGTANEFARDRTNVVKLYYALEHDTAAQIAFYHPGLGTMEPAGALTPPARYITRGLGMAMGYGLSSDIGGAYTFLMNNYQDDDFVYLFGFSRGAYTARAVCSLLTMYGLIRPGNDPLVPYAVRMMLAIDRARKLKERRGSSTPQEDDAVAGYFQLAEDFKRSMGREGCNPYFVGVWDTVSSVGWVADPVKIPYSADNPSIRYGRHAIAIDEKRAFFRTNRWVPSRELAEHGPRDVKQVWFPGVHCDVGGGYPEDESALSKIPLEWMLEEARAAGLRVNPGRQREILGESPGSKYQGPDPDGPMHESLKGWWKLAEVIEKPHYDFATGETVKRANRGRRRTIPRNSLIHESVFQRRNGAYADGLQLPDGCLPVATVRVP
ncbi:MAG: DUF2235 domain-containing protein [Candidatus Sulfopaludibacter sp.]|nr:DUF2235 domain-containing protein [Candidatus Sulfopaludibacter sp.]